MIEKELPTGFHDGQLFSIAIDREHRTATLELEAIVSLMRDDAGRRLPDLRRRCHLQLTGVVHVRVDGPFMSVNEAWNRDAGIDDGPLEGERLTEVLPGGLPPGTFGRWFWLHGTHGASGPSGFLYIIASGAELLWLGPPEAEPVA